MQVAEKRSFPSAEAVIGDGNGHGNVDAHHAHFDVELKLPGGASVARENRRAVAVGIFIDDAESLIVRIGADDTEDRPEDFVLIATHAGFDTVQQAQTEEKSLPPAGCVLASVDSDGPTLRSGRRHT